MGSKEESAVLLGSSVSEKSNVERGSKNLCRRLVDKLLAVRRSKIISVEVAVFLYCFSMYMANPVSQQFLYQYYEVHYLRQAGHYNYTASRMCLPSDLQKEPCGSATIEECAQRDSSYLIRNVTVATTVIMAIAILLIGPLSDKLGRKFPIILAAAGSMLSYVFNILVIYTNWPIAPLTIVGGLVNGATGGLGGTMVGSFAYVSDITTHRYRTLRLGFVAAVLFIGGAISQYLGGLWLKENNCTYEHVLWCALAVQAFEIVFVIFGFPESRILTKSPDGQVGIKKQCINCNCHPMQCLEVFKIAILKFIRGVKIFFRFKMATVELWLALVVSFLYVMNSTAIMTLTVTFLKGYPLLLGPETIGIFSAASFGLAGIVVICVLPILSNVLKLPDPLIAFVSTVPAIMAYFMISYLGSSLTTWEMFLLTGCSSSVSLLAPTLRSWMSKRVEPEELGALFSYTGFVEIVTASIAAAIYDSLFPTLGQDSYYLMSGLYSLLLPFALVLLVIHAVRSYLYRRQFVAIDHSSTNSPIIE